MKHHWSSDIFLRVELSFSGIPASVSVTFTCIDMRETILRWITLKGCICTKPPAMEKVKGTFVSSQLEQADHIEMFIQ